MAAPVGTTFPVTERTKMRRKAKRATYDRDLIHSILDEALIASVAVVIDGRPQVQPMIHLREGDSLIFHGLSGNRLLCELAAGTEACINVAFVDAVALARRIEDHSMHYRSATIYGRGTAVTSEDQKREVMERVFVSLIGADRLEFLPPLPPEYLRGTMVVRIPIEHAVGKVNDSVDTADGPGSVWSGIVPVTLEYGLPRPDDRTAAEPAVPSPPPPPPLPRGRSLAR